MVEDACEEESKLPDSSLREKPSSNRPWSLLGAGKAGGALTTKEWTRCMRTAVLGRDGIAGALDQELVAWFFHLFTPPDSELRKDELTDRSIFFLSATPSSAVRVPKRA